MICGQLEDKNDMEEDSEEKLFEKFMKGLFILQNLDVNLAVNNLLSRDEDDGDDDENPEYLPGGETVHFH